MSEKLKGYLRGLCRNGFTPSAVRFMTAVALTLLLPVATFAYTIVLRSGRRLEIPAKFTVTNLTLTYETAPGINITLLISTIDIPATERANKEPAGALLKRAEQKPVVNGAATRVRQPRRELTNQDIEAARRRRQKSEQDYERRRVELGLPSIEETRRRTEEEMKRLSEVARQSWIEEAEAESYWRSRAAQLRTEITALDAQINYVNQRLAELPDYASIGAYNYLTGIHPTFPSRRPHVRFPSVTGHPGFMRGGVSSVAQGAGFLAFGGIATQGRIQLHAGFGTRGFGRRGIHRSGIIVPAAPVFGVPGYDATADRANLISRLHELEAARAGLRARWRLLEEEARRAGAQPGWLRP